MSPSIPLFVGFFEGQTSAPNTIFTVSIIYLIWAETTLISKLKKRMVILLLQKERTRLQSNDTVEV